MIASIINTLSIPSQPISRHAAVIGAGAAGLAAARELRREGHKVVVFERENQIGGTWVYDSRDESHPLSIDPTRPVIHSSLYSSLRTNLPREVMGFKDYPFIPKNDKTRDPRRYPGHREVLLYLQDFAKEFELEEMVRFETEVVFVGLIEDSDKLKVTSKRKGLDLDFRDEVYDAVVVCNGHYSEPSCAQIPGIGSWPGKQIHSHNYRVPEPFKDKVVIVIGYSSSGIDISMEIAGVAKEVHVTARPVASETLEKQPGVDNLCLHSMIDRACEDGSVIFQNGKVVNADIILHCTGYIYHFPFLESGIVNVDDNRVEPLYKHVFPPALAPSLSFVGLPRKALPFPMFEFQSKWIAGILSGRIQLPSEEEMMEDVRSFYHALEASNIPKRYTHNMGDSQFEYNNWLAEQCGCEGFEEWRKQIYYASGKRKRQQPVAYRDQWADDQWIAEAYKDFSKYAMKGFSDIYIS